MSSTTLERNRFLNTSHLISNRCVCEFQTADENAPSLASHTAYGVKPRRNTWAIEKAMANERCSNDRRAQFLRSIGNRIASASANGVSGAYVRIWLSSIPRTLEKLMG